MRANHLKIRIRCATLYEMELSKMKCVPCELGGRPLSRREIQKYMARLKPAGTWRLVFNKPRTGKLVRDYEFGDFAQAMKFINRVARVAEANGHHPNIYCSWNKVQLELFTHSIGGLAEADFVMASKINLLK